VKQAILFSVSLRLCVIFLFSLQSVVAKLPQSGSETFRIRKNNAFPCIFPLDAFDQTLYRFRHNGMPRPALSTSRRVFVWYVATVAPHEGA